MKKKYLPLYFKWMKNGGWMPEAGLCNCFGDFVTAEYDDLFKIMIPDNVDMLPSAWAGGENDSVYDFTELRQNIVLLMAALNNEL